MGGGGEWRTCAVVIFFFGQGLTKAHQRGAASILSQKKGRPGMKEGPLVQMLDRQRMQQAASDAAWTQASIDTPYPPDASGPGNLLAPDDVGERKLVSCTVADARNDGGSALCRYNDSSDIAPPHLCSTQLSPLTLSPIHIFLRTLVRLRTRRCQSQWFGGLTLACRCTCIGLRCLHRVDSAIIQISLLAWITLQLSSPGLNTTTSNLDGMVSPRW